MTGQLRFGLIAKKFETMKTELDHIVVAAKTLDEGRAWAREVLGVEASGGGKHAGLATHNTLIGLNARHYLEIIAIDADAGAPDFPRWFGLDTEEVQSMIAHGPRLVAWVARASGAENAIETFAAVTGNPVSVVRPAQRGDFRWRFAFTPDGARPRGGVLPHLIQWDVPIHPCDRLPDVGLSLSSLLVADPVHERISAVLDGLAFSDIKVQIGQSTSAQIIATLQTPHGNVMLE
jgi:Glyoxalase-like domain